MLDKFGKKLLMLRTQHGLTVRELGKAVGISIGHITQMETGKNKPSLEVAFKIARFFNVSVDDLADDEVEIE
jgi:putative transcriptional regulator